MRAEGHKQERLQVSVRSMTGYGRGESEIGGTVFRVEIRAVNHKNLDTRIRLPRDLLALERDVLAAVRGVVHRGHLEVFIAPSEDTGGVREVKADTARASGYVEVWNQLSALLGTSESVPPEWLAAQEGVIVSDHRDLDPEESRDALVKGVEQALATLSAMRDEEGETLRQDLLGRLEILDGIATEMETQAPVAEQAAHEKILTRIESLREKVSEEFDGARVEQELVLLSERMDIMEEVVRLRSHVSQMRALLNSDDQEPRGKRLGFLVQELFREATTVGSKAGDLPLSNLSVDARCEIERVREQIMNIE
jgi:uncharacterized protein (TIGR00255 family)